MSRAAPGLTARVTNLSVLATVLLIFATGVGAVATGSPRGRWVVIAHGIAGIALVFLTPWKGMVMRRGWRRGRPTRWASLMLGIGLSATVVTGLASATGLAPSLAGFEPLWWHVALALGLVPPMLFHLVTRPVRIRRPRVHRLRTRRDAPSRRTGVPRRAAVRLGAVAGLAATTYLVAEALLRLTGAPGARRRFTGSYEVASRDPAAMPVTMWLNDHVPVIDTDDWRLTVVDTTGRRELRLADLARAQRTVRAVLDCTSGWYAEHEWTGVPVSALVTPAGSVRSLYVHSITGYWVRFPVGDIDSLLLATRVSGLTLLPGHGYPVRLVAPGRRGFWWVKWVDRIELDATPSWWQPPLPVT